MGLIFAARPFCPPDQEVDAAVGPGGAVGFEMQFGDVAEGQSERQFAPEVMAGMLQGGDGVALFAFSALDGNLDAGVLRVGAYLHLGYVYRRQARILKFEPDQLGKLLPHGFGYP